MDALGGNEEGEGKRVMEVTIDNPSYEDPHCIPEQPIFESADFFKLFGWSAVQLSRIRAKGHLRNIPGIKGRVVVPRAEVIRYVTLLPVDQVQLN